MAVRTIDARERVKAKNDELGDQLAMAVVTGDVQTQNDADRLAKHTYELVQAVVTDGACHLDARQVQAVSVSRKPSSGDAS